MRFFFISRKSCSMYSSCLLLLRCVDHYSLSVIRMTFCYEFECAETGALFWDENDTEAKYCLILFECRQAMLACSEVNPDKLDKLLEVKKNAFALHLDVLQISVINANGVRGYYLSNIANVYVRRQVDQRIRTCIRNNKDFFICCESEYDTFGSRKRGAARKTKNKKQFDQRQRAKTQEGMAPTGILKKRQSRLETPMLDYSCISVNSTTGLTTPSAVIRYCPIHSSFLVIPALDWKVLTFGIGSYGLMLCNESAKIIHKVVVVDDLAPPHRHKVS